MLLACLIAAAPVPALAQGEPPPAERTLRLLYTGFTGGLPAARFDLGELGPLFKRPPTTPRDFEAGGVAPDNAFRHGDMLVYTDQGPLTLADFRALFASGPVTAQAVGPVELLASDYAYVLDLAPPAEGMPWALAWLADALGREGGYPDVRRTRAMRYQVANGAGLKLWLLDLGSPDASQAARLAAALASAHDREMTTAGVVPLRRAGTTGRPTRLLAVGRPLGDGLRRAWLARTWKAEAPDTTFSLDLGNCVDSGFSELSVQQRAFTMRRLGQLGLDALVPAENELGLAPAEWDVLAGQVAILAANLEATDPRRPAPTPVIVRAMEGLKVAVIGLVDDRAALAAGVAGPHAAWRVTDPLKAAQAQLSALVLSKPDLVVLATNVRDERLQSLRHLNDATVVLADMVGLPGDLYVETVALSGEARARVRSSYMVAKGSPNRVGRLEATYGRTADGRPTLVRLRNSAQLVTDRLPHEEGVHAELNELVDKYQRERRELLLPDMRDVLAKRPGCPKPADGAIPNVDGGLWGRLVANVARRETGAEVAIVRVPAQRARAIGAVSRLVLEGWLEVGDRPAQLTLPGKALKAIAAADAPHHALAFAGFDPGANTVMGVPLNDDEWYRVTTTDLVARHAHYAEAFGDRPLADRWHREPDGP